MKKTNIIILILLAMNCALIDASWLLNSNTPPQSEAGRRLQALQENKEKHDQIARDYELGRKTLKHRQTFEDVSAEYQSNIDRSKKISDFLSTNSNCNRLTSTSDKIQLRLDKVISAKADRQRELTSMSKKYPDATNFIALHYDPIIDRDVQNSNSMFPTINSEKLRNEHISGQQPNIITLAKTPTTRTIFKKGNDMSRLILSKQIEKAICDNNLKHIAVANKSVIRDGDNGWIVVAQGIVNPSVVFNTHKLHLFAKALYGPQYSDKNFFTIKDAFQKCSIANSISLDEIKDLTKLAEETGFIDFTFKNINMVRDSNNNNKLTIIDTDKRAIQHFSKLNPQLDIIDTIEDNLGINLLTLDEYNIDPKWRTFRNIIGYIGLDINPEVKNWINERCKKLSKETPQYPINSLLDPENKYNTFKFNVPKVQEQFTQMNSKIIHP